MAVLRQGETSRSGAGVVTLDLGDLRREADRIRAHAVAEAERIVRDGMRERDRLIAGAREEGRAQGVELGLTAGAAEGREAGLAARKAELVRLEEGWTRALDGFVAERERLISCARADVVALALAIAERVVRRTIEHDAAAVEAPLRDVLAQVMRAGRVKVRVNPADAAVARAALPALLARLGNVEHAEIIEDGTLECGSCIMQTPCGGVIDASVGAQLDRLAAALLPERRA